MSKRLLLLGLIALLALVLGFFTFSPARSVEIVRYSGYWIILASTVLFGWFLIRSLRSEWPALKAVRQWWPAGLVILGGSVFIHLHERHEFKIVADEVVLSSTAMQMHFERETAMVLRGYEFAGNFSAMQVSLDKRPLLFPFLLSMVHDLTGYRVANVFILNALVSVVMMAVFYLVGRRLGGHPLAGVVAVLLVCAVPLIAQNATGGGFELLNVAMIVVTLWLGLRYAERTETDRLCAFVLSGVLLAQTRYESVLFIAPVGVCVLYIWFRECRVDLPWPLIITPLLLLLYPLQHNVFKVSEASWQLNDVAGATSPFGFRYFYDNIGHAMNFFLNFDGVQPSSWLVAILGVFATGVFVLTLYREHREIFALKPETAVAVIFIAALIGHTVLMLCYFWGKWDDPIIRRLSLPAHVLMILAIIFVMPRLFSRPQSWRVLIVLMGLCIVGFTVPTSAMQRYTQENFAARTTNWLGGYIKTLGDRSVLAIDNAAGLQWFLYRKSSVNPQLFAIRFEEYLYHFRLGSFNDYLVVQRVGVDLKTGAKFVSIDDDVGPGLKLEVIEEKAFSPIYLMRLSRVVGVDEEKMRAWVAEKKQFQKDQKSGKVSLVTTRSNDEPNQLVEWLKKLP